MLPPFSANDQTKLTVANLLILGLTGPRLSVWLICDEGPAMKNSTMSENTLMWGLKTQRIVTLIFLHYRNALTYLYINTMIS